MSKESVLDFIGDFDIDVTQFDLPCGTISFDDEEPFDFGDDEPDDNGKGKSTLGVLVSCDTESEMEQVFQRLKKLGLNCRMVE